MRYKLLSLSLATSLLAFGPLAKAQSLVELFNSVVNPPCNLCVAPKRPCCDRFIPSPKPCVEVFSYVEGGVDFIKGYAQIPPELPLGLPSSRKRPTFSELDIDSDLYCGLGIDLKYYGVWAYFHYQQMTPSNTTVLNNTLTTFGHTIEAGELFSMYSDFQWLSFGLGLEYTLVRPCIKFSPLIDANWVNYTYTFSAQTLSGYQNLRRPADGLFTVRVGGRFNHTYRDCFSTQLILMGSPPFLNLTIYEANFSIAYHLYERDNFRIRPYIGIKWLFMDLNNGNEDSLIEHYEARPAVFVGFNFLM
jgi:hypothetical protein